MGSRFQNTDFSGYQPNQVGIKSGTLTYNQLANPLTLYNQLENRSNDD